LGRDYWCGRKGGGTGSLRAGPRKTEEKVLGRTPTQGKKREGWLYTGSPPIQGRRERENIKVPSSNQKIGREGKEGSSTKKKEEVPTEPKETRRENSHLPKKRTGSWNASRQRETIQTRLNGKKRRGTGRHNGGKETLDRKKE